MSQKIKVLALVTFTILGVALLVNRHLEHQAVLEKRVEEKESQALMTASQRDLAQSQDELNLITEIDRYKACNRNMDCENLYPRARKAIEDAEAEEAKDLERKSTYRE